LGEIIIHILFFTATQTKSAFESFVNYL